MTTQQSRRVSRGDLVLKIYGEHFGHDSREQRELETIRELGLRAMVLTKGRQHELTDAFDWEWKIVGTRPLGESRWMVHLNRMLSILIWARVARRARPAVISGHDLVGTLIGWLSTLFLPSSQKPVLLYDQHELIVGLYVGWRRRAISALEGFLMRRSALTIAVNDSIADRMRDMHRSVDRPVVVRSMPRRWSVDSGLVAQRRQAFLDALGIDRSFFLLMYHGVVCPDRGIERMICVLDRREQVALVVLGDGTPEYIAELKRLADERGVTHRVLFWPSVRLEHLGEFVAAADAGLVTVPNSAESYYLMLPNKFFENVQAGTPVIASDFPEVRAIVNRFDIGLLVDPADIGQIGRAVDRLHSDAILQAHFRGNLIRAKQVLCWENEQQRLRDVYVGLMD